MFHKGGARFGHLPLRSYTCIYAAELRNGAVKVGRTSQPSVRMDNLLVSVRTTYGCELARVHVGPDIGLQNAKRAERRLIERMRRIGGKVGNTAEYFQCIPFGVAVNLVNQMSKTINTAVQGF